MGLDALGRQRGEERIIRHARPGIDAEQGEDRAHGEPDGPLGRAEAIGRRVEEPVEGQLGPGDLGEQDAGGGEAGGRYPRDEGLGDRGCVRSGPAERRPIIDREGEGAEVEPPLHEAHSEHPGAWERAHEATHV